LLIERFLFTLRLKGMFQFLLASFFGLLGLVYLAGAIVILFKHDPKLGRI